MALTAGIVERFNYESDRKVKDLYFSKLKFPGLDTNGKLATIRTYTSLRGECGR